MQTCQQPHQRGAIDIGQQAVGRLDLVLPGHPLQPDPAEMVARASREMCAVVWARVTPAGILVEANAGFSAFVGGACRPGADVRRHFSSPGFGALRRALDEATDDPGFTGFLTLADDEGCGHSLLARVHRVGRDLLLIGEHDVQALLWWAGNLAARNDDLTARHRHQLRLHRELQDRQIELERLALTDQLTGVPNRRGLLRCLRQELGQPWRSGGSVAVALADIDRFKAINDRYGHHVGDRVLRAVAQRLCGGTRAADEVGRWGGEEFLLILPGTGLDAAAALIDRLRLTMADRPVAPLREPLTLSFGVTVAAAGDTIERVIERADEGLFQAKRAGRNRVAVLSS